MSLAVTRKTALITGITGQDGSYLADLLLQKGYRVIGYGRPSSIASSPNVAHLRGQIEFVSGDLLDTAPLIVAIKHYQPDEIFNLASQSYPGKSWQLALETAEINGMASHRLFEAVRQIKPDCRIYQASSSEMFGVPAETPQNETTAFNPVNPYAAAKVYAHHIAGIYRKSFRLFIVCGILFNHESPRRGMHFITQKVTYAAACIKLGITNSALLNEKGEPVVSDGKLSLGNLDASRDWGCATDYVEAMWLMLQQQDPQDFVIGTGQSRTIRDLCNTAFTCVGHDWHNYVRLDEGLSRPTETGATVADASRARKILGWTPRTSFDQMILAMINVHLTQLSQTQPTEILYV